MQYPIWSNSKLEQAKLDLQITGKLNLLAYSHSAYFDLSKDHLIVDISKLAASRARPIGISNANNLMSEAALGKRSRRAPVKIMEITPGNFVVIDGNSTFLNALYSGWPDLPCQVIREEPGNARGRDMNLGLEKARSIVTRHLDDNEQHYLRLLEDTNEVVNTLSKILGPNVVYSIYSRKKKQKDKRDIKEKAKIVKALLKKWASDPGARPDSIVDIVGMTVVVFYNDQIPLFIEKFAEECSNNNLRLEEYDTETGPAITKVHKDKGYHATHLKVRSDDPSLVHVTLELQIKTMLHDAWGAKMHDLTYKPTGELDPKLQQLMESFGDSLQAIEVQSETLRDAILNLQRPLQRLRREARLIVMENLASEVIENEKLKKAFHQCLEKIQNNADHLSICAPNDALMVQVTKDINALISLGLNPFIRLKLTVYLASLREDTELAPTVDRAIQDWEKSAKSDPTSAWIVSAAYHQTNRLNEAITYVRNYIAKSPKDPAFLTLRHNLANYLIESCALGKPTEEAHIEIKRILEENEPHASAEDGPGMAAFNSTMASYKIVFGSSDDLNAGLALAYETVKTVQRVGRGYLELYIAYGWQRKLRLQ